MCVSARAHRVCGYVFIFLSLSGYNSLVVLNRRMLHTIWWLKQFLFFIFSFCSSNSAGLVRERARTRAILLSHKNVDFAREKKIST